MGFKVFPNDLEVIDLLDFEHEEFRRIAGRLATKDSREFSGDVFVTRAAFTLLQNAIKTFVIRVPLEPFGFTGNHAPITLRLTWGGRLRGAIKETAILLEKNAPFYPVSMKRGKNSYALAAEFHAGFDKAGNRSLDGLAGSLLLLASIRLKGRAA